ncbi:MAG TPA: sensor histidine kinase, partial [Burkholderiales bacterium]
MPYAPSTTPQVPMLAPTAENLQRLVMLRYLMVAAMAAALAVASSMEMAWEPGPMALTLGLLVAVNMATHWRVRRVWPVTNAEFLAQLLLDVTALTALLYWSGGSGNPLVSLYLIPVVVAAAALPAAHTWFMAALTVGCYSWLILTQDPLAEHHHHGADTSFINFHLTGMWLTFALSAALVALFVARMARSLRDRDRRLAVAREESLRNERIVALGTMAAG